MGKTKVLIVEDEWIIASDIEASLLDLGYDVTAIAASGEEALKEIERQPPDIVLMDIILPDGMNGIEAAGRIRERFDIPVVYVTAYGNRYLMEESDITDQSGYLLKPFKNQDLRTVIELALKKAGGK